MQSGPLLDTTVHLAGVSDKINGMERLQVVSDRLPTDTLLTKDL